MKSALLSVCVILCLASGFPETAQADTRMQVKAISTPIFNQAGGNGQPVGSANAGEILFVSRIDGDWVAISPPDRITLWLNKDFIEDNRVLPNEIPVRSGPGIQHPVVGKLHRGDPVLPRGEQGEWCKIAPPSSCVLWARAGDLEEIQVRTSPIREVEPKPQPVPEPKPTAKPEPAAPAPVATKPAAVSPEPVKVTPTKPQAKTAEKTAPKTAPKHTAPPTATQPKPAATKVTTSARSAPQTALHPATALPTRTSARTTPKPIAKKTRPTASTPASATRAESTATPAGRQKGTVVEPIPTPAKAVKKAKTQPLEVEVDPALVEDLELIDAPNQGKPVQVEGEIRNAPFLTASPSRYRLLDYSGSSPEMVCHIHGDSKVLRQYVGKGVSIRGREYWVESSDMPVVIVGELVPLEPDSDAEEPVLF